VIVIGGVEPGARMVLKGLSRWVGGPVVIVVVGVAAGARVVLKGCKQFPVRHLGHHVNVEHARSLAWNR
jgi:hypothetical protein